MRPRPCEEHILIYALTGEDIGRSSATIDFVTNVPVPPEPITKLVVSGTVYYEDGKSPVSAGLTVKFLEEILVTDAEGKYSAVLEEGGEVVARSGDEITITVEQEPAGVRECSRR